MSAYLSALSDYKSLPQDQLSEMAQELQDIKKEIRQTEQKLMNAKQKSKKQELSQKVRSLQDLYKEKMDFFILSNTRLVVTIATKMAKSSSVGSFELMDLIAFGNEGLIQACQRFDPSKGNFAGYAGKFIRHTIQRNLDNLSDTIRLPVSYKERHKKFKKAYAELLQEYGREPTVKELAEATEIREHHIKEMLAHSSVSSSDINIGDDEGTTIVNMYEDETMNTEDSFHKQDLHERLMEYLFQHLSEREAYILILRFGLEDDIQRTLEDVGNRFNISRERVRQISNEAIDKLKKDPEFLELFKIYTDAAR